MYITFDSLQEYVCYLEMIMLETSQERVKFLKAGISAKTIEQLYLQSNCVKIIRIPVLYDPITTSQTADFSGERQ